MRVPLPRRGRRLRRSMSATRYTMEFRPRESSHRNLRVNRGLLQAHAHTIAFVLELLEPVLFHEGKQLLHFTEVNSLGMPFCSRLWIRFLRHLEFDEVPRRGRKVLAALCGHHYVVLDTNTAHSFDVYARFHRDHHALFKDCFVTFTQARHLVHFDSEAVTSAVSEVPNEMFPF